jgi:hypothetical protein
MVRLGDDSYTNKIAHGIEHEERGRSFKLLPLEFLFLA